MKNGIVIASVLLALAAPAGAIAAPAKLSRADASASARATVTQVERGVEQFGYHAVAKLDQPQRLGPRRFRTVVSLIVTASFPGARDSICLLAVYTRQTRDRVLVSRPSSLSCTPLS
jgi:hypothetical protein